ncbi:bifunctional glyoxylate/hydroxypyruvate reductase B [Bacillus sp. SA1-12]|uniref:2-hydroxyacid dehydrogenase n=1 Tax=Bacillus sp. SA1-12 TaxID=1455638 RepID=UPI000627294F|nr:D-glycerate dehydrogenase [Bacillus sp. SA1-12]KKI89375.1 bifunctional glyoxylate/hydroxypyruvate reductase B [Bacillus sp. SA1-12]
MKQTVIIYRKVPEDVLALLKEKFDIKYFNNLETDHDPDFLKVLPSAHGLLGASLKVNKEFLDQAPNLKIVSNISVGYDNLDLEELKKRGIQATNTPGVLVDTTADTVFGLLLATARRMPELDLYVKTGKWKGTKDEDLFGVDVHHKVLGIIGLGDIGKAIAKRGHFGFDMEILYHNRSRNAQVENEFKAAYCELDELLSKSDYVCLMTPHTPETDKMIGEREFRLMRDTAIFINGSRGKNVDESALIKALQSGQILAAGLDVYETEPVNKDNPLLNLSNVVTLPHIGSATKETREKMARLAAENLVTGLEGGTPPNLII